MGWEDNGVRPGGNGVKALQDKLSDLLNQNWILWDTGARNGELMPCRVSRTSLVAFFFSSPSSSLSARGPVTCLAR